MAVLKIVVTLLLFACIACVKQPIKPAVANCKNCRFYPVCHEVSTNAMTGDVTLICKPVKGR